MSFWEKIDKLSKEKKERYALSSAFIVTGLIATVWITTLPAILSSFRVSDITEESDPFKQLLNDTETQLGNVEQAFEEVKDIEQKMQPSDEMLNALGEGIEKKIDTTEKESVIVVPNSQEIATSSSLSKPETTKTDRPIVIEIKKKPPIVVSTTTLSDVPRE